MLATTAMTSITAMSGLSECCRVLQSRPSGVALDRKVCTATNVRCHFSVAPQTESHPSIDYTKEGAQSTMNLAAGAVNALFQFQPFFRFAAGRARSMIIERGAEIGYPWPPMLAKLRQHNWEDEIKQIRNKYIEYPEYYLKPFHAYEKGNLSWDAAWEVELAAKSVHATTFDLERNRLDPEGDVRLRNSYHSTMVPMLKCSPKAIVDIGCSTGLSTFGLHEVFPDAHTVGVDLSPYFISVANYNLKEKGNSNSVQFLHAAGEYTGLPSGAYDLVSICLVCHELPRSATKKIIEEAHRLLKVGGALAIMEMDPRSVHFQNMVKNVFAFTAFKATEPWVDDYRTFPIEMAIVERGFSSPTQESCSPRHRTIVAHKK
ncbi:unnamed protein product [Calypogeia fissa]